MYHVLVPVDTDDGRARRQAAFVAALPAADGSMTVTVAHALSEEGQDVPAEMQRPDRVSSVKAAVEVLEDAGIETSVREANAPPADGVLSLARDLDVDHVVVAGRHADPVGKALFGSVAQSIVLNAERPVTVVGED